MSSKWTFVRGIIAGAFGGALLVTAFSLEAQVATIDFVVPQGTSIATGATGEKVVFIQKSTATDTAGNCGTGELPVQTIVTVDPAGTGAAKISGVIVTSQAAGITPGTRLQNITQLAPCGTTNEYVKYRGEIQ